MPRRAMEGEELAAFDRRRKRPDLVEMARLELHQRPLATCELIGSDLLVRLLRHLEEEVIGIAEHDRPTEVGQAVEDGRGLVAALRDVAEHDPVCDPERLELGEHRFERPRVSVDVGEEGVRHRASLTPRGVGRTCNGDDLCMEEPESADLPIAGEDDGLPGTAVPEEDD